LPGKDTVYLATVQMVVKTDKLLLCKI